MPVSCIRINSWPSSAGQRYLQVEGFYEIPEDLSNDKELCKISRRLLQGTKITMSRYYTYYVSLILRPTAWHYYAAINTRKKSPIMTWLGLILRIKLTMKLPWANWL